MDVVLIGIVSSFIASVVYALLSFGIKPKIKISKKICVTENRDGTHTYKIKIVNKSRFQLINVSYHLVYGTYGKDDISYVTEILPKKPPISVISRKSRKNTDYALRVNYEIDENKYACNENSYFEFTVQATHWLSNSIKCKKVRYYSKDIAHNFTFHIGEDTNVIDLSVFNTGDSNKALNV